MKNTPSRTTRAGNLYIGGGHPLTVQSMTNIPAEDTERSVAQILALERAGCDIVRLAVLEIRGTMPLFCSKRLLSISDQGCQRNDPHL